MGYIKTLPLPPPRCRSVPHQLPPASAVCNYTAFFSSIREKGHLSVTFFDRLKDSPEAIKLRGNLFVYDICTPNSFLNLSAPFQSKQNYA